MGWEDIPWVTVTDDFDRDGIDVVSAGGATAFETAQRIVALLGALT
jgi:hypothetical protein